MSSSELYTLAASVGGNHLKEQLFEQLSLVKEECEAQEATMRRFEEYVAACLQSHSLFAIVCFLWTHLSTLQLHRQVQRAAPAQARRCQRHCCVVGSQGGQCRVSTSCHRKSVHTPLIVLPFQLPPNRAKRFPRRASRAQVGSRFLWPRLVLHTVSEVYTSE